MSVVVDTGGPIFQIKGKHGEWFSIHPQVIL